MKFILLAEYLARERLVYQRCHQAVIGFLWFRGPRFYPFSSNFCARFVRP